MKRIKIGLLSVLSLVFLTSCINSEAKDNPADDQANYFQMGSDSTKSDSIQHIITKVVNDGKAPGMIAAIISSEGVIAIGSAGERKAGSGIAFTTNNVVHLGSCGKAMTATMLATLVAEGKLSWDIKLIEAIPELKDKIHTDYHKITLWQLLTHRAGLPKNSSNFGGFSLKGIKKRRLEILEDNLKLPATYEIDKFNYSNFGYIIAACMAEQITGLSWEVLMKKRLFDPLGMSTAGFGNPNKFLSNDQPWGHKKNGGKWRPSSSYNVEIIGPAGRIHCSIADWAKFLSLQLTSENPILERKYLDKLIEPVGSYASGWFVGNNDWVGGIALKHGGTNGIWYAEVIVSPHLDRAFVLATNSCDIGSTPFLFNKMMKKLIRIELFNGKPEPKKVIIEMSVEDAILETYVGKYELMQGLILTITKNDSQLKVQLTGQGEIPIIPIAQNKFVLKGIDAQLTFNISDAGEVESVTLYQNGMDNICKRLED